ncbi:MAG: hypothetical protein KDF63_03240, partial [Rhodoferax sp.]|nr:hypothetical protein [Rhodoferax sp.]
LGVGAVGALVLAGVAFVAVLAGIRAWRNLRSPVVRVVPLATLGYVAAVNLTETYIGPNLLPWVLLVGVLAIGWGSVPKAGDHTTVGKT